MLICFFIVAQLPQGHDAYIGFALNDFASYVILLGCYFSFSFFNNYVPTKKRVVLSHDSRGASLKVS